MAKIVFDSRQFDKLHDHLQTFNKKAIPFAMREGINRTAFRARKVWQKEIAISFQLRGNKWTAKGAVQVDKARGSNVRSMEAVLGHVEPYMKDQEEGAIQRTTGKHGKTIATSAAAGQRGARPRTRLVTRRRRISAINLSSPRIRGTSNKKQRVAMGIRMAKASGKKFVFLNISPKNKGIYELRGKRPKLRKIWEMSHTTIRIKREPTLEPTVKQANRFGPRIFTVALAKQVKRAGLFR